MGVIIGLLLGVFFGFYGGNAGFRQKLNKSIGGLIHKAVESQGSDDKKTTKKTGNKKKEIN